MARNDVDTVPEMIPDALKGFYSQTKAELDTPTTFEALIADSGLSSEDLTFLGSPYRVLSGAEKKELVNRPFGLRAWRFATGDMGEYVICYAIIQGTNEHVILTDGSTGILAQLNAVTTDRIKKGHPTPLENLIVVNGLRVSEYGVDDDGRPVAQGEKAASIARTYYLN